MIQFLVWQGASAIASSTLMVRATLADLAVPWLQGTGGEADPTLIDQLRAALREALGPPLKALHHPIDLWLGDLPMWVATACVICLYVVTIAWVWTLRRDYIFRGAQDERPWRDLRVWATLVVMPYIAIYLLLGR